jgi:hypothetical protein
VAGRCRPEPRRRALAHRGRPVVKMRISRDLSAKPVSVGIVFTVSLD